MKWLYVLIFALFLNFSCTQRSSKPITEVSQNEINSVRIIDVRTLEEYEAGHLENAININWYDSDFATQFEAIAKDETIYLYCKKGGRSAKAQAKLMALGYTNIVNLEGGYDAYMASRN